MGFQQLAQARLKKMAAQQEIARMLAARDRRQSEALLAAKEGFARTCFEQGGQPALAAIKRYGKTEVGEPIRWSRVFEEIILLTADMRIGLTVLSGNAQGGKTISQTLVLVYFVATGQVNCAWFYDSATNLDVNMPFQFEPIAEDWMRAIHEEAGIDPDRTKNLNRNQTRRRYRMGRATAIFSYASTSAKAASGKAEIGSVGASFQSSINFEEEKSQWPNGVDFGARLEASVFDTKPVRMLGTPGSGQGIERDMVECAYHFYPHTACQSCGQRTSLDPKGALLKQFSRTTPSGDIIQTYFSISGRPQSAVQDTEGNVTPAQWHHTDPSDPVGSAYVACVHCLEPIPFEARTEQAFMACLKTEQTVPDFLEALPPGAPAKRLTVAQQISPLIRARQNVAAEIIEKGLNPNTNPSDWQQQVLGHPSEILRTGLTFDIIKLAVEAVYRPADFDVILAGLDQGTSQHWLWIAGIKLPPGSDDMDIDDIIARTVQVVLFAEPIAAAELPALLDKYGVGFGMIDNEPGRDWAESACADSPLEMGDQVHNLSQPVKRGKVESGSTVHDCWFIRNERFLSAVIWAFFTAHTDGSPLMRCPQSWETFTDPGVTEAHQYSPIQQLLGPTFDVVANKWKHGPGGKDDLFYACMFQQAALYIWLKYKRNRQGIAPTIVKPAAPKANRFFRSPGRSQIKF